MTRHLSRASSLGLARRSWSHLESMSIFLKGSAWLHRTSLELLLREVSWEQLRWLMRTTKVKSTSISSTAAKAQQSSKLETRSSSLFQSMCQEWARLSSFHLASSTVVSSLLEVLVDLDQQTMWKRASMAVLPKKAKEEEVKEMSDIQKDSREEITAKSSKTRGWIKSICSFIVGAAVGIASFFGVKTG